MRTLLDADPTRPFIPYYEDVSVKVLGLVINPIAGMGGKVGLKGTDGKGVLRRAVALGAQPIAPKRAETFLRELGLANDRIQLIVGAGIMGEDASRNCGLIPRIVGRRKAETAAEDTRHTAGQIVEVGVDLLIFCGGDGTARDILRAVGTRVPVLGVPTGVKMHSAVFAVEPKAAANMTRRFLSGDLPLRESEVMDVEEGAYREGRISARLYGYLLTPYEPHLIQGAKMLSPVTEEEVRNQVAVAIYIIENMQTDVSYILGPGTITRTIGDLLDAKKTPLGVDIFCNKKLVAKDVNEHQVLKEIDRKEARIVVTPIGGQGFIFGRGNQQISPTVIRHVGLDNIIVIATEGKLRTIDGLRVDTGDPMIDDALRKRGLRITYDYKMERMERVK